MIVTIEHRSTLPVQCIGRAWRLPVESHTVGIVHASPACAYWLGLAVAAERLAGGEAWVQPRHLIAGCRLHQSTGPRTVALPVAGADTGCSGSPYSGAFPTPCCCPHLPSLQPTAKAYCQTTIRDLYRLDPRSPPPTPCLPPSPHPLHLPHPRKHTLLREAYAPPPGHTHRTLPLITPYPFPVTCPRQSGGRLPTVLVFTVQPGGLRCDWVVTQTTNCSSEIYLILPYQPRRRILNVLRVLAVGWLA